MQLQLTLPQLVTAAVLLVGVVCTVLWARLYARIITLSGADASASRSYCFAGICANGTMCILYIMSLGLTATYAQFVMYALAGFILLAQQCMREEAQSLVPARVKKPTAMLGFWVKIRLAFTGRRLAVS